VVAPDWPQLWASAPPTTAERGPMLSPSLSGTAYAAAAIAAAHHQLHGSPSIYAPSFRAGCMAEA